MVLSLVLFAAMLHPVSASSSGPLSAPVGQAQTTLHGLFTDNMVLQRGKPIAIWGTATPGQKIAVMLNNQAATTEASARGNWNVTLPAMQAGGPYSLVVRGDRVIERSNVAIGEVWVCSGQSNMEWHLEQAMNGAEEVAAATYPDIRLYHVNHRTVDEPLRDLDGGWSTCKPETAHSFSAVGYFFGRALYKKLHVPIGLIESDWGGTPAESWTPRQALLSVPSLAPMVTNYLEALRHLATATTDYQRKLDEYNKRATAIDLGNVGIEKGYQKPDFDDKDWKDIVVPGDYKSVTNPHDNGGFWYRKAVDLPAAAAGVPLKLELGAVDDFDVTYFNGVEVGKIGAETPNWYSVPRNYSIPGELVKAGKNVVAVRVWNSTGPGGLMGPLPMRLLGNGVNVSLDGTWKFGVERAVPEPPANLRPPVRPLGPGDPWVPSSLYNGMISCLVPYGIRGAIWYQGESNADRAFQYRTLFPTMIKSWRAAFGQGDFPFYFVQLANYSTRAAQPVESQWAELREAQTMTLGLPNTGMAVAIDIGAAETIHPLNKQEVGHRLSLLALNRLYGMGGEDTGPTYKSMSVEGNAIRIRFMHTGGGLFSHGGPLVGFQIAGADHKFVWAEARIERDSVVVSAETIKDPVAVRYGWDINPATSLYNGSGLPASPFRTDDWPSPADGPRD
jgi:sialate O-acetylesterase